jgi:hypothetical protein
MIFLDSTLRKLQVVLAGAVTTTQLSWVTSYVDIVATPGLTPASATGATNSATPVDVVAAPAASTQRQLKYLNVFNADTVAATVTVQFNDNGTVRILMKVTLAVGQSLVFDAENAWSVLNFTGVTTPTRQVLTGGTTYTTPTGARQIRVRMLGGAGGGCGGSTGGSGATGVKSTFNAIDAAPGAGATVAASPTGGAGGVAGTGSASVRFAGEDGNAGGSAVSSANVPGGNGGNSTLGGGGAGGYSNTVAAKAAAANSGGGGGGAGMVAGVQEAGGGGGAGEYVELIINNPAATYTYAIGTGGIAGTTGTGSAAGAGASGVIIVDEFY